MSQKALPCLVVEHSLLRLSSAMIHFQMSKTVKRLEKENLSLKKKCEKSDVSLIELLGEVSSVFQDCDTPLLIC